MADLSTLELFTDTVPDNAVNAARVNNAFATLRILPEFITSRGAVTPVGGDTIPFFDLSGTVIGKCTFQELFTALADPAAGVAGPRTLGTSALKAAAGNDDRFPADVTGIRKGVGAGKNDVAATESDLPRTPNAIGNSGTGATIPCVSLLTHTITMTGNATLTITGLADGAIARVLATQDASGSRTITWVHAGLTFKYVGASAGPSTTALYVDLFTLHRIGTVVYVSVQLHYA